MMNIPISKLPDFEGKEYLLEAQRRGVQAVFPYVTDIHSITIVGLAQIIAKLQIEIEMLRNQIKEKPQ